MAHHLILFVSLTIALMVNFSHGSGNIYSSDQAGAQVRVTLGVDSEIPMPNGTTAYKFIHIKHEQSHRTVLCVIPNCIR